jgi:amino acid transporter
MNLEDKDGGTVLRRTPEKIPVRSWRSLFIGRPLPTADAPQQAIGKFIGLAVFASDALSSTAYATQELLVILIMAGMGALRYSIPISFAIVGLLTILIISYEQVIHAYPGGGGAYIVARDNLGETWALIAGAALLTDYILTVSVSISSGVAQITSAYPPIFNFRVELSVIMVFLIMLINLRGVKESGLLVAIPSYFFVAMMFIAVGFGLFRYLSGTLPTVVNPPPITAEGAVQTVTFFLLLRAFSNGTSAVTGVEAISNGITAFKEPRSKNAGITLMWMALILGSLMLAITFLAFHIQAIPSAEETVISQLGRTVFLGRGGAYLALIIATTIILVMAANTAFAGFPRLGAITAEDGFLPRQLTYRGDRLVYSNGIIALAVASSALIVIFGANVNNLIPLYAIGVFLSFTLAQIGMAWRWWKSSKMKSGEKIVERGSTLTYEKGWQWKLIVNGFGAITTGVVMVIFAVTKFKDGAWIVILLLPILVLTFFAIYRHYQNLAGKLSLSEYGTPPTIVRHRVLLLLGGVHRGSLAALRYARTLSHDITAAHVSIDPEETEKLQKKWETWGDGTRLVIIESPYRVFIEPLLEYIEQLESQLNPNEVLTIVVPQFVPGHFWSNFLHSRTANTLRNVLLNRKDIVITEVPYQVD